MTDHTDLKLLEAKVTGLEDDFETQEEEIRQLRAELILFENKIKYGKGVLVGILFALGSIGFVAFDKLRVLVASIL